MRNLTLGSIGLVASVFCSPLSVACNLELIETSERRWNAKMPDHYSFEFRESFGLLTGSVQDVPIPSEGRVEISRGTIVDIWYGDHISSRGNIGKLVPVVAWRFLTISPPSMFAKAKNSAVRASIDADRRVECTFDPNTGLLARLVDDSRSTTDARYVLEVSNFKVLP
jgi:hypothetical protein